MVFEADSSEDQQWTQWLEVGNDIKSKHGNAYNVCIEKGSNEKLKKFTELRRVKIYPIKLMKNLQSNMRM